MRDSLIFVVITNFLLSAFNFWLAWKIWQLRGNLAKVVQTLTEFECRVNSILCGATGAIFEGKKGSNNLRELYIKLEAQYKRLEQIFLVLSLLYRFWSRRGFSQIKFN